jgi:hypothetical protein
VNIGAYEGTNFSSSAFVRAVVDDVTVGVARGDR